MKPIIISVTEDANGYIRMKKSDFEKCIMDAYECGKAERRAQNYNPSQNQAMNIEDTIRYYGKFIQI